MASYDAFRASTFDAYPYGNQAGEVAVEEPSTYAAQQVRDAGSMTDPQQARFASDAPGTVRPMEFPRMERSVLQREAEHRAAAAAANVPLTPQEQAAQIVAEARSTARAMLSQAREAIAAEREQVVRDAHAEAHAQGMAQADQEMAGLIRTCEQIGVQVMEERARLLEEQESEIVELALAVARRIVNASIEVDHTLVVEACRGAMRKAFQRESLQVLAHPDDLLLLREAGPQLASELGGVEHLDFVEERRLEAGSVIVRTPAGEIDGTIRGKADKIEQALREGIEQRRAERRSA